MQEKITQDELPTPAPNVAAALDVLEGRKPGGRELRNAIKGALRRAKRQAFRARQRKAKREAGR